MLRSALTAAFALLLLAPPASAAWEPDFQVNQPVCEVPAYAREPHIMADGAGGCLVVWSDPRNGVVRLYGQRLDAQGDPQWANNGTLLFDSAVSLHETAVTYDPDTDTLWVLVQIEQGSAWVQTVQAYDGDGVPRFAGSGVDLSPGASNVIIEGPVLLPDGYGGVFAVWSDTRNYGTSQYDIYAQRIRADGGREFGDEGLALSTEPQAQRQCQMVASTPGTVIVAWNDDRNIGTSNTDIYGQRLDIDGSTFWSEGGRFLAGHPDDLFLGSVTSDGYGGALLAFNVPGGTSSYDIRVQRIEPIYGFYSWGTPAGRVVCDAPLGQTGPLIVSAGPAGAYVVWNDSRLGDTSLFGQFINLNGFGVWEDDGRQLMALPSGGGVGLESLVLNDDGDLLILAKGGFQARAQRVTADGTVHLELEGRPVSNGGATVDYLGACSDGRGGMIAVWGDSRIYERRMIMVQRVDRFVRSGRPEAVITDVRDRPGDQGGEVIVSWDASPLDTFGTPEVDRYTAWMRLPNAAAAAPDAAAVAATVAASGLPKETVQPLLATGWAYAAAQDAVRMESYALHLPTYGDSTDAGAVLTEYRILTHDDDDPALWPGEPVGGWSVDNLAPGAPLALAAALTGVDVDLTWSAAAAPDLAAYRVHRSAVPGFTPSAATLVGTAADTLFTDAAPPAGPQHYVVTAVDVHGNEGDPSNEASVTSVTAVADAPAAFALHGARPNPFNPATTVMLEVPRDGRVTVQVYDARGARVRALHDGPLSAGRHPLTWRGRDDAGRELPSGVYFARAVAGETVRTVKLTLAR